MHLAQGSANDGKILCEHVNEAAINGAITYYYAFTGRLDALHAKIGTAMLHKGVQFHKGARIQQSFYTLARCLFAFFVLRGDSFLAAARKNLGSPSFQVF